MKHNRLLIFPRRNPRIKTISEHVREYAAIRKPRGNYKTPMPNDYREVANASAIPH